MPQAATADTGPVDDPGANTNEQQAEDNRRNFGDNDYGNRKIVRAGQFLGNTDAYGILELAFTQQTATVDFQVTMQPGDNYRVAAAWEKEFLLELENNDKKQNLGADTKQRNANKQRIVTPGMIDPNNPASVAQAEIRKPQNYASDVLTTWRLVHVEVDSMGPVQGNIRRVNAIHITPGPNNTSAVKVDGDLYEKDRFQDGKVEDSAGKEFEILSNANIVVTVKNKGNTTPQLGGVTLRDDDHLQDGQDVPRPDTSKLEEALAQVFIVPVYDAPGSEDNVPFVLNVQAGQKENAQRWNSKALNQQSFWGVYLLGAFQGSEAEDNAPIPSPDNRELLSLLGAASKNQGGALIYLETIVDVSRQKNRDRKVEEQETVIHEVGHLLGRKGTEDDPDTPEKEGPTLYPETPHRCIPSYLHAVRSSDMPWGDPQNQKGERQWKYN